MDRMKRIMALTVSILAVAILASASSWEGSAMMGAYGDFPPGGYFAACNSFPRNTAVEVTNLETGKTVTVIIVRGLDNPGIFMMVSAEAAEALGLLQGTITRVRAVEPRSVSTLAPSAGSRTALDADFNPRLLAAEELKRIGYDIVETPAKTGPEPEASPAAVVAPKIPEAVVEESEAVASVPDVIAPLLIPPLKEGPELVQDLIRPVPAAPEPDPVPVPSPEVPRPEVPRLAADEKPDAINGGKPKPVRTVVLPELPEPELPLALAVRDPLVGEADVEPVGAEVLEEPKPEIFALTLPIPDETPLRVSPSPVPRRFEAPAALPDVLDRPRTARLAPEAVDLSLAEPESPGPEGVVVVPLEIPSVGEAHTALTLLEPETEAEERAETEVRGSPTRIAEDGSFTLAEPVSGMADRVVAHELLTPTRRNGLAPAALAWPELEADEIPDIVLARLTEPVQMIPATSLAEGEIIFPHTETPHAIALETPSFAAAETRIALAAPELEARDQAEILDPRSPGTLASELDVELAEADLASEDPRIADRAVPEPVRTAPDVAFDSPDLEEELPGEVIVIMEPTDLRPPVVAAPVIVEAPIVVEAPPEAKAPETEVKTPDPIRPEPVAVPVKPAMATGALEKGRHYIQVGAYRTEAAAAQTVSILRMDYVIVLESPAGSTSKIWKIFVGPMGRDESGMALLRVRSLGFKDAFLKVGG